MGPMHALGLFRAAAPPDPKLNRERQYHYTQAFFLRPLSIPVEQMKPSLSCRR